MKHELVRTRRRGPAPGGPYYVRAVGKAIAVLEAFRDGPAEMTLSEVAGRLGLNRATAYRLLMTLERHRLIQRSSRGVYRLGLGLVALGGTVQRHSALVEHAAPHLRRLAHELEMTSFLSVLDGDEAVCLYRVDAGPMQVARFRLGERLPLHLGAGPLALLAGLDDGEVERILGRPLQRATDRSVCDPATVRARLARLRVEGVALSDQDVTPGVGAIGAPVKGRNGETLAAVSVSALAQDLFGARMGRIVAAVRETAGAVGVGLD